MIDVNLTGTFLTVRESVEAMVNGGWEGIICLMSSINKEGQVGQLNYSATKAAVALMPKILVGEFMIRKIRNIRVVAIAPGYVNTAILRGMNQEALAAILKDVHSGKLVEPEEIAASIMHCIENDAINATTIEVTGGLTYARSRATYAQVHILRSQAEVRMKRNKVIPADVAVSMVRDGWVLGAEGFVGSGTADELYVALEKRYLETGSPEEHHPFPFFRARRRGHPRHQPHRAPGHVQTGDLGPLRSGSADRQTRPRE